MIRVNLLPHKKKAERGKVKIESASSGQRWVAIPAVLLLLEAGGFTAYQYSKKSDIDQLNATNTAQNAKIAQIQQLVTQHQAVKDQLKKLQEREDAINQLKAAQNGPTSAILELAQLMTPGKGPTVDPERAKRFQKDRPLEQINLNWDSKRLWLTEYQEQDRTVKIDGFAKDSKDVTEFATRLNASSYFYDVVLLPGKKEDTTDGLVSFGVQLKVRY